MAECVVEFDRSRGALRVRWLNLSDNQAAQLQRPVDRRGAPMGRTQLAPDSTISYSGTKDEVGKMANDKRVYVNGKRYEVTFHNHKWSVWISSWGGVTDVGKAESLDDAIRLAKLHQGGSRQKVEIYDR